MYKKTNNSIVTIYVVIPNLEKPYMAATKPIKVKDVNRCFFICFKFIN